VDDEGFGVGERADTALVVSIDVRIVRVVGRHGGQIVRVEVGHPVVAVVFEDVPVVVVG